MEVRKQYRCNTYWGLDSIPSSESVNEGPVTIEGVTYSDELQALVEAAKSQIKNPIFLQLDVDLEYRLAKMRG